MKVSYSPRSLRDLEGIRDFIAAEAGSRQVADRYIAKIIDACDTLVALPQRYAPYRLAPDWRMMPFESYLVFFTLGIDFVLIGHIRHAARKPFRT